jgi:hypothetical protein
MYELVLCSIAGLMMLTGAVVLAFPTPVLADAASNMVGGGAGTADPDKGVGRSLDSQISTAINMLLWVVGASSVIMIIYGAIRFITSAGNPEKVKAAKNTIMYAVIGLAVALLAWAIVNFVVGNTSSSNTPSNTTNTTTNGTI